MRTSGPMSTLWPRASSASITRSLQSSPLDERARSTNLRSSPDTAAETLGQCGLGHELLEYLLVLFDAQDAIGSKRPDPGRSIPSHAQYLPQRARTQRLQTL